MRPSDVYWHIYRRGEIKPELRGRMIYVLEIPRVTGCPVLRHVFDPLGHYFPCDSRERISALMTGSRNGIIYNGISKAAAYDVMLTDPRILKLDTRFVLYNHEIVCNSRKFFLVQPEHGFDTMPEHTARLLCGHTFTVGAHEHNDTEELRDHRTTEIADHKPAEQETGESVDL
jgi:hypothetical protein